MEAHFPDELRLLGNALRQEGFRFILIGKNRYSLYRDIARWLRDTFAERPFLELRLRDKTYHEIADELRAFANGIVLIPDFDWLLLDENEPIRVAFNQRRDSLARLDLALVAFIEPDSYRKLPVKLPDWWSLRSLELDFYREAPDEGEGVFLNTDRKISSLGGQTAVGKRAEISRLEEQLALVSPDNKSLLLSLYNQLARLWYDLSEYGQAHQYLEQSLRISQEIGDKSGEGTTLNNLGAIYWNQFQDVERAVPYFWPAYQILDQLGSPNVEYPKSYLTAIKEQIGEARFNEILQSVQLTE